MALINRSSLLDEGAMPEADRSSLFVGSSTGTYPWRSNSPPSSLLPHGARQQLEMGRVHVPTLATMMLELVVWPQEMSRGQMIADQAQCGTVANPSP